MVPNQHSPTIADRQSTHTEVSSMALFGLAIDRDGVSHFRLDIQTTRRCASYIGYRGQWLSQIEDHSEISVNSRRRFAEVPNSRAYDLIYRANSEIRLIVEFTVGRNDPDVSLGVVPSGGRLQWAIRDRAIAMHASNGNHEELPPGSVDWRCEYRGRTAVANSPARGTSCRGDWWDGPTNRRIMRSR